MPDAAPEQLDRPLGAVGLEDAGAAELQEEAVPVAGDQPADIELAGRIEAAALLGHGLAEQPVSTDDRRAAMVGAVYVVIEDQQMIAEAVIAVAIAP